jgi:hypothetical protein
MVLLFKGISKGLNKKSGNAHGTLLCNRVQKDHGGCSE